MRRGALNALRIITAWAALLAAFGLASGVARAASPGGAAGGNYTTYCARCHGAQGQGDGPSVPTLATKPQKFTDCAQMAKLTDATMFNAIKYGGPSVGLPMDMPSWNNDLDDAEIHALVKFVRGFCHK